MLRSYHKKGGDKKIGGGDAYFYYLNYHLCDGNMRYTYVQTHEIIHMNYVQLLYTNYTSSKLEEKRIFIENTKEEDCMEALKVRRPRQYSFFKTMASLFKLRAILFFCKWL